VCLENRAANENKATLKILENNTVPPSNNPIENAQTFVAQQYADFLGRVPDPDGLAYWTNQITRCGSDAACIRSSRVGVSAAFFVETKFQQAGGFVARLYRSGLGRRPEYLEFMRARGQFLSYDDPETARQAISEGLVGSTEFLTLYPEELDAEAFIDSLLANLLARTGVDLGSERDTLLADLAENNSRGRVVRLIAENPTFKQAEFNPNFVLMQYFGYLRRNPEQGGFDFWLNVLNSQPSNFRGMVCAFLTSREYQERFSPLSPRNYQECASLP
jgi:Domain of unknown function (DUF4214)